MVVLLYVKMIFFITEIVCITTSTSSALRKNRSMRVPIYSLAFGLSSDPPFGSNREWGRDSDAPNPRVPLITLQPTKFLWISGDPIPHCCVPFIGIHIFTKIGQSLLYSGSSTQHTTCDAPKPGCPLTTRQPAEYS